MTLKNHPFAVEAFFESSVVLTYAVHKKELAALMPPCLELDLHNNDYAFVAAAFVQTKNLRPKGFPAFMGNNFILTGYRVFVRYTNKQGKRLRGLYILKSETDKKRMAFLGNIFTHYNYTTTDIEFKNSGGIVSITSKKSALDVVVDINNKEVALPSSSPFANWKEARRFAGPLPFTFTYHEKRKEVLVIEGVRQHWEPRPVEIIKSNIGFIGQKKFSGIALANAFIVEQIPYCWKKGIIETWEG